MSTPNGTQQKFRVIIRISLNGDTTGAVTMQVKTVLKNKGIRSDDSRTGTYEGEIAFTDIDKAVGSVWQVLSAHADSGGVVTMDHFWMYVDHPQRKAL